MSLAYLEEALASDRGIALTVKNPARLSLLRSRLYELRKSDPKYSVLSLTVSTRKDGVEELWIMRTDVKS